MIFQDMDVFVHLCLSRPILYLYCVKLLAVIVCECSYRFPITLSARSWQTVGVAVTFPSNSFPHKLFWVKYQMWTDKVETSAFVDSYPSRAWFISINCIPTLILHHLGVSICNCVFISQHGGYVQAWGKCGNPWMPLVLQSKTVLLITVVILLELYVHQTGWLIDL